MVTPGNGIEEMEVIDAVDLDKGVVIPSQCLCKRLQDRLAFLGHYRSLLNLCRQLALSDSTNMAFFCLK